MNVIASCECDGHLLYVQGKETPLPNLVLIISTLTTQINHAHLFATRLPVALGNLTRPFLSLSSFLVFLEFSKTKQRGEGTEQQQQTYQFTQGYNILHRLQVHHLLTFIIHNNNMLILYVVKIIFFWHSCDLITTNFSGGLLKNRIAATAKKL